MNIKKMVLYTLLALIGASLWSEWLKIHPPGKTIDHTSPAGFTKKEISTDFAPPTFNPEAVKAANQTQAVNTPKTTGRTIRVKTDVLDLLIDPAGGNIIQASLPQYPVSLEEKEKAITILNNEVNQLYITQGGLTNTKDSVIQYVSDSSNYQLAEGKDKLEVILKGRTSEGLNVIKTYVFYRDKYAIEENYTIVNNSSSPWQGSVYGQFKQHEVESETSMLQSRSYAGAAVSTPKVPYQKISYKSLAAGNLSLNATGGWVAMQQRYFITSFVTPLFLI